MNKELPEILLVNPPLASPMSPPRRIARAAGLLAGLGLKVKVWEASLELWQRELLPGAGPAAAVLRGSEFYEPKAYLDAWAEVRRAGERFDPDSWRESAATGLAQRLPQGPALLLINLAQPEQWPGAHVLAKTAKELRPDVTVALLGGCLASGGGPGQGPWDHLLSGPRDLCRLWGLPAPDKAPPDFSGLPLDDYLSPQPVLGLGPELSPDKVPEAAGLAAMAKDGACLLRWSLADAGGGGSAKLFKSFRRVLKEATSAGLWNHLELPTSGPWREGLLRLAGTNPHLVHSWSLPRPWPWQPGFGQPPDQPHGGGYAELAPLSGAPLWRSLAGPAHLWLYLQRHGPQTMRHWWLPPDGPPYRLGDRVSYHYHRPADLPPKRLEEIASLILAAGKVGPKWLRHNLEHAYLVGWAEEQGVIVGTDTLKRPRQEYIDSVREQSGYDLNGYAERGYISILPQYRGLGVGSQLIQDLVARAGDLKMFVIVGRDNKGGEQVLLRNRTRLVATYYSRLLDKEMGIWMPVDQEPPTPAAMKAEAR